MACLTLKRSYPQHQHMDCSPCSSSNPSVEGSPLFKRIRYSSSTVFSPSTTSTSTIDSLEPLTIVSSPNHRMEQHFTNSHNLFNTDNNVFNDNKLIIKSPFKVQQIDEKEFKQQSNDKTKCDRLQNRLLAEVKRLERRGYCSKVPASVLAKMAGVLKCASSSTIPSDNLSSSSSSSAATSSSSSSTTTTATTNNNGNSTQSQGILLTLDQACMLCDQIWKERESELREEYNQVLLERLSEQFETFAQRVEQLMQNRSALLPPPSYVS